MGPRQSWVNGLYMIVLENNEFWGVYGYLSNGALNGSGFIQGKGVSKNGRFSSTSGGDFILSPSAPIKIEAEFIPGKSFKGNLQGLFYPVGTGALNLSPHPEVYLPASNEIIQGSWKIIAGARGVPKNQIANEATKANLDVRQFIRFMFANGYSFNQGSLSVSASGTLSGTHQKCSYTGTISPRPKDKNIYNVSLNFAADGCNIPSRKATGIAVATKAGSNRDVISIMAVTENPSSGIMLSFYRTKNE